MKWCRGVHYSVVPLDFQKYRYVVPAVRAVSFFPGANDSLAGTAITSMSKLSFSA